jgi:hypothetical protein
MITGRTLFIAGIVLVVALAAALHVYGPHLGRILHGGQ